MATINASVVSLQDITSRMNPDGAIAKVIESLSQTNAILQDAHWMEGNLPTGHKFVSRTKLPSGTWRAFNQGVAPTKSKTAPVTETCAMLEAFSKVDCALAKLNGNEAAFRASENEAFVQGLSNQLEEAFIYASQKTDPEKFTGFAPRLDLTTGPWGGQIIDSQIAASGSDQSSMYAVVWGPNTAFAMFPKGMPGGLQHEDLGKQLTEDADGNEYTAWVSHWVWNVGLCVPDPRYLVRLANIDTSAVAETGKLLIQDMVKMVKQLKDLKSGKPAIYCNRKIETYLHLQALDSTTNSTLSIENIGGKPVTHFLGIPIRVTDEITNTEAIVS